ncbi:unnamed protein product [Urochloa humidicola]
MLTGVPHLGRRTLPGPGGVSRPDETCALMRSQSSQSGAPARKNSKSAPRTAAARSRSDWRQRGANEGLLGSKKKPRRCGLRSARKRQREAGGQADKGRGSGVPDMKISQRRSLPRAVLAGGGGSGWDREGHGEHEPVATNILRPTLAQPTISSGLPTEDEVIFGVLWSTQVKVDKAGQLPKKLDGIFWELFDFYLQAC